MVTGFVTFMQVQLNDEQFSIYNFLLVSGRLEKNNWENTLPTAFPTLPSHVQFLFSAFHVVISRLFQYTFTQDTPKTVTSKLFQRQFLSYLPWWIVFRSAGCNTTERPIQKHQGTLPNDQAMVLYPPLPSHKCLGLK